MQTKQNGASKGKPSGAASDHRKPSSRRKLHKQKRAGSGDASKGKSGSAIRDGQPSSIEIKLKGRTSSYIDLVTLPKGRHILDTEEKMLKAIEDLYPVVSQIKGFKDNERWGSSSPVSEVFHQLYGKFLRLQGGIENGIVLKNGVYKIFQRSPVYFPSDYAVIPVYWMDLGNSQKMGQVILGTFANIKQPKGMRNCIGVLPTIIDLFPDLKKHEKADTPSCSLAEALNKQDLFINPIIANYGANLIWKMFRELRINYHGLFLNLETMNVNPIKVK